MKVIKGILLFIVLAASSSALALDQAAGKVTYVHSSGDHEAFYFKIDTMPNGINYFYSNAASTGAHAGCNYKGSENILSKQLSTVLMAKASQYQVKIQYCADTNGYGLISTESGFIAVE